jgi:hypothetical protein
MRSELRVWERGIAPLDAFFVVDTPLHRQEVVLRVIGVVDNLESCRLCGWLRLHLGLLCVVTFIAQCSFGPFTFDGVFIHSVDCRKIGLYALRNSAKQEIKGTSKERAGHKAAPAPAFHAVPFPAFFKNRSFGAMRRPSDALKSGMFIFVTSKTDLFGARKTLRR